MFARVQSVPEVVVVPRWSQKCIHEQLYSQIGYSRHIIIIIIIQYHLQAHNIDHASDSAIYIVSTL